MTFKEMVSELETLIIASYQEGTTVTEAEALATRFLEAQLKVSAELRKADLDSRMRKSGVKAIKAAVYLDEAKKGDKKPSDVMLGALVDANDIVAGEQKRFDEAEADRDELERIYNVFREAHIHFRSIAKGRFDS
jgi:hypothetical protein